MVFSFLYVQAASTWNIEIVDSIHMSCNYSSIALDSKGNPHIAYQSLSGSCLKYAVWTGSEWIIETVDDPYARDAGRYVSIAVDSNDNPHICYLDFAYASYKLKYASWDGSEWSIQVMDGSTNHCGEFCCLVLDSNDNPHISYLYQGRTRDVRYAKLVGSEWSIETADSPGTYPGAGGEFICLALDSNDNPHISYHGGSGELRYASGTGSEWIVQTANSVGVTGWLTSIALDSNDNPHISHFDYLNEDLLHTTLTGSTWSTETVDSMGDVSCFSSIALDSDDNPNIAYYSGIDTCMKYARWTGAAWSIENVDSTGSPAGCKFLALDSYDNPHISCSHTLWGYLKYVQGEFNTAPVLGLIGPQTTDELVQLEFTATATDVDIPAQTLTFSLADGISGSVPLGASITSGGDFSWTPSEDQGPGKYTFDVVVSDGVDTDSETVTVVVNDVNVAPVIDPISEYFVYWDEEMSFTATANDADLPVNTLSFSLMGAPSGASITSGGYFTWTPSSSQIGEYSFTVRVEDDGLPPMYDEQEVTIEIGKHPTQLVYSGDSSGQYSDPATVTATLTDTVTGTGVESKTITFAIGSQWKTATTTGTGVATTSVTLNRPAGSYTVESVFAEDSWYLESSDSDSFTINKETVTIEYTGDTNIITAGTLIGEAPVRLAAHLTQIDDGYSGNLEYATVKFVLDNQVSDPEIIVLNQPVGSSADFLTIHIVPVGNYLITVTIDETNQYWTQDETEQDILWVNNGEGKGKVIGNGWIFDSESLYRQGIFHFDVDYRKAAVEGNFSYQYTAGYDYNYLVKSVSWQDVGLSFTGTNIGFLTGWCTLEKTDISTGQMLEFLGYYRFTVDFSAGTRRFPPTPDTIAIKVWNPYNGTVWRQIGTSASQIRLRGGDIRIQGMGR